MGTQEFGHQTERRRRRVMRLVAAGFAVLVLVIAAYRWKSRRNEKPLAVPKSLPSNVSQQLSGYSFTRSDKSGQVFTVHAARTIAFQGDETVLSDVSVEVFGRTGEQHDLIRTRTCNYNRKTGELFAEGQVQIELNAPANANLDDLAKEMASSLASGAITARVEKGGHVPVYLETSHLSFVRQGSLVVTDSPVKFRAGQASGTAQGLIYATRDDWVELKKNVMAEMKSQPGKPSSTPIRLAAARLRFEKATGTVTLWGPVQIDQGKERVTAAAGQVRLDARNRVTGALLEGDVMAHAPLPKNLVEGRANRLVAELDPATSLLRQLRAEDGVQIESKENDKVTRLSSQRLRMYFSGRPSRPMGGLAEGEVHISSEGIPETRSMRRGQHASNADNSKSNQDLTASAVRFVLAPSGKTLTQAETIGPGTIVLTSDDPKSGPKIVSANPFVLNFDEQGRPWTIRGLSEAQMIFKPAPVARAGTPEAVTTSDKMLATFDHTGRALSSINQTGNFRFVQGEQRGSAENAHYDTASETVTLTGHPRLWDEETRAQADRFLINSNADTAEGIGHVQTSHLEKSDSASPPERTDPTNVVADRMMAKRQSQFVHYEGNVRVWHDSDVIQSEAVDVFKGERRVRTDSSVLTSFLQPARSDARTGTQGSPGGKDQAVPVTIRADGLEYSDKDRKATYRGNVRLETQDATLHADRLDVFFTPAAKSGNSEIERALATGNVTVVQPGRRATGDQAEYFAQGGKVILSGGPPTLYDSEKGFATGRQLTFFMHDDKVFLDGGDQSPTLSKHRIPQ